MNGVLSRGVTIRCLLVVLLCLPGAASAYTLSFAPAAQSVALGNPATVDVRIAGILPGPPGSNDGLGDYDFDVVYDPAIIAYNRASDAFSLGFAIGLGVDNFQAGRLKISDFSLEPPDDLLALQSDTMLLLTLVFDSLSPGTSTLLFEDITLGDVLAGRRTPTTTAGSITVRDVLVPEPGTLALFAGAVAMALGARRRRRTTLAESRQDTVGQGLPVEAHQTC
jgi:hypothetical protein